MKKILFFVFALALVFFTFSPDKISARVLTSQNGSVNLATTETIDDDLFVGAQNVTIDGTVNGDTFIGGRTVMISGTINGNLHIGAATIVLSGKVSGNVYVGSGNLTVTKSSIDGSLIVGAGNVSIDKETIISGSVIAGVNTITIDSWIRKSVYLGTSNAILGSDTRIGRDLYYITSKNGQEVKMTQGVVVSGNIYKTPYQAPTQQNANAPRSIGLIFNFVFFLGAFLVGILYSKFFSNKFIESAKLVSNSFWKSLGVGFLISIAMIPAIIIALITIIGIPLAGVSFLMFLVGLYFAKLVVAMALGNWIALSLNWDRLSFYWVFGLGLAIIYILKPIPFLGGLVSMVVMWTGLGALVMQAFYKPKK